MPSLTVTDDTLHTVWDLHFTNYDPRFWAKLLKPREGQALFDQRPEHPGASSGSGVLPGPKAGGSGAGSGSGAPGASSGSGVLPGPKAGGSGACSGSEAGSDMHSCDGDKHWLRQCWSYGLCEGESSFEGHRGATSGSGVLPGPAAGGSGAGSGLGASSESGHPYVGHECDTGSFWVQYHGTNVYGALTAAGQHFISRSEAHKFDAEMPSEMTNQDKKDWEAAQKTKNKAGFETDGAGREV
jgi:hypothetical protein